ncbi:MAG: hypothetical protein MI919_42520 [Holophagales bacterium]|nr:hypothetical protein [Holophagales bacterium]
MLVCRPSSAASDSLTLSTSEPNATGNGDLSTTPGGPVFVPRRQHSSFAEALLAELETSDGDALTPYDSLWNQGRPVV